MAKTVWEEIQLEALDMSLGLACSADRLPGEFMRHQHLLRLMTCLAVAVPGAALSSAVVPGEVSAAVAPLTVTCTTLSGNGVTQTLSHCTGTGAVADEAGAAPARGTSNLTTRTITWSNGKRAQEDYKYKNLTGKADTCAVKAKYTKEYLVNEWGYVAYNGTTAKGMAGGTIRAMVCVYRSSAAPHSVVVVNQGKIKI